MHQESYKALSRRLATKIRPDENGCWIWIAGRCHYGYGALSVGGKTRRAHRYVYQVLAGRIPDRYELHHVCEVRECVNPMHLEPLSPREHRALQRGKPRNYKPPRKERCVNGHVYDEANTSVRKNGHYFCRTCHRERARARSSPQ
jgi:hypothetical protein